MGNLSVPRIYLTSSHSDACLAYAFSYMWDNNHNMVCLSKSFLPYKGQLKRNPEQEEILCPLFPPLVLLKQLIHYWRCLSWSFPQGCHHHQLSQHIFTSSRVHLSLQCRLQEGRAFCVKSNVGGQCLEECLTHRRHSISECINNWFVCL